MKSLSEIIKAYIPDEYGDCEIKKSQKRLKRERLEKEILKWHNENNIVPDQNLFKIKGNVMDQK